MGSLVDGFWYYHSTQIDWSCLLTAFKLLPFVLVYAEVNRKQRNSLNLIANWLQVQSQNWNRIFCQSHYKISVCHIVRNVATAKSNIAYKKVHKGPLSLLNPSLVAFRSVITILIYIKCYISVNSLKLNKNNRTQKQHDYLPLGLILCSFYCTTVCSLKYASHHWLYSHPMQIKWKCYAIL